MKECIGACERAHVLSARMCEPEDARQGLMPRLLPGSFERGIGWQIVGPGAPRIAVQSGFRRLSEGWQARLLFQTGSTDGNAHGDIAEANNQARTNRDDRVTHDVQTALVIANGSGELRRAGLTTPGRRELVVRRGDESLIAIGTDAAEQYIEVRAGNVTAEGNACAVRAHLPGAFAACISGGRADE